MQYLVTFLAFAGGALLIFGVNLVLNDVFETQRQRVRKRLEEETLLRQKAKARKSMAYKELYEMAAEGVTDLQERPSPIEQFVKFVDESGANIKPGQLVLIALLSGGAAAAAVWLAFADLVYLAVAGTFGTAVPLLYVSRVRAKRREKLLSQLPDGFDLMARTMRAGQTISQALQAVADEFSDPIAAEFRFCCEQQNLGLSPEAALRELARRTGLLELKIFVLSVMIHRTTGGNLSQLLDKLASVIRHRYRIRGSIRALTAEGRAQALVLLALPIVMFGLLLIVNRAYIMTLFEYPLTIGGMFASMGIGALWMRKIVNVDI